MRGGAGGRLPVEEGGKGPLVALRATAAGAADRTRTETVPSADAGITRSAPATLMGLPVYVTPYVPALITTSAAKTVMAVVGDIRESYSIREWAGIGMIRDDITLATTGQVKYTAMSFANANITRGDALVQLRVVNV